jgi:hypothetical protein
MVSKNRSQFLFIALLMGVLSLIVGYVLNSANLTALRSFDTSQAACDIASFGVSPPTGQTFTKGCLLTNQAIYSTDSRFLFFNPLTTISNLPYVVTPNSEIKDRASLEWSIELAKSATVYLFTRHIPGIGAPAWVSQEFGRQTNDDLSNINQFMLRKNDQGLIGLYDVWKRDYPSLANIAFHAAGDNQNQRILCIL